MNHATPPTEVYLVPVDGAVSDGTATGTPLFFLKPESVALSAQSFAEFACGAGIDFVYSDRDVYVDEPGMDPPTAMTYRYRQGLLPYLDAMEAHVGWYRVGDYGHWGQPCELPEVQLSRRDWSYGFYCRDREASWDGVVFKPGAFTRQYKVPALARLGSFADAIPEMGWWKVHGSFIGLDASTGVDGRYDFDATSPDDVHYAMAKTLAYERSMGLQLDASALNCHGTEHHGDLDGVFTLLGRYHRLAELDIQSNILPDAARDTLARAEVDAELVWSRVGLQYPPTYTYQFVRKQVARAYLGWPAQGYAEFEAANPFGSQRGVRIEIRPRFQFDFDPADPHDEPWIDTDGQGDTNEPGDVWLAADWETLDDPDAVDGGTCSWTIDTASGRIDGLELDRSQGQPPDDPVICRVDLYDEDSTLDLILSHRRGFAIHAGSDQPATLLLHLDDGVGYRDHLLSLDSGPAVWRVQADPSGDLADTYTDAAGIEQTYAWGADHAGGNAARRYLHVDYAGIDKVSLFVAAPPTSTFPVRISLPDVPLALQESASHAITNPSITVTDANGVATAVAFADHPSLPNQPLVLSLDGGGAPAILRYRGWTGLPVGGGDYELFTQDEGRFDYGPLVVTPVPHDGLHEVFGDLLTPGPEIVTIRVESADTDETRAEVRVTFFDDEDMDGWPTHCLWDADPGAHLAPCDLCTGHNSFCRDPSSDAPTLVPQRPRLHSAPPRDRSAARRRAVGQDPTQTRE